MTLNSTVAAVTDRIRARSQASREAYLKRVRAAASKGPRRSALSCGNAAHGFAACPASEKTDLAGSRVRHLVTGAEAGASVFEAPLGAD